MQEKQADREELFQIIKDRLTKTDYLNLLKAHEVTDLLPILFELEGGIDKKAAQTMFKKAIRDGYTKAALLLFNEFPEINLSFRTEKKVHYLFDEESNEIEADPLEHLIDKIQDGNADKAPIKDLLILLLKQGNLSELESDLLSCLFSGSETSSDLELIESLLNNKTYTLEQYDVKEALDTIAGFDDIPATGRILIRHVTEEVG